MIVTQIDKSPFLPKNMQERVTFENDIFLILFYRFNLTQIIT